MNNQLNGSQQFGAFKAVLNAMASPLGIDTAVANPRFALVEEPSQILRRVHGFNPRQGGSS